MTVEEILSEAIQGEIESYELYTNAVEMVRAEHIKGLLRELAQEELGHKVALERMLNDPGQLHWQVRELRAAPIEDYKISDHLLARPLGPDSTFQDVCIFASKKEKQSFELYRDLAAQSAGEVRGLLEAMAKDVMEEDEPSPYMPPLRDRLDNEMLSHLWSRSILRTAAIYHNDIRILQASLDAAYAASGGEPTEQTDQLERRLAELVGSAGEEVLEYAGWLRLYSERLTREAIRAIPDGAYAFEVVLDDDGFGNEEIRIAVRVEIAGDEAGVDFAGSSPQVDGPVNANLAVTLSAAVYVFRCLAEADIPFNQGCF